MFHIKLFTQNVEVKVKKRFITIGKTWFKYRSVGFGLFMGFTNNNKVFVPFSMDFSPVLLILINIQHSYIHCSSWSKKSINAPSQSSIELSEFYLLLSPSVLTLCSFVLAVTLFKLLASFVLGGN